MTERAADVFQIGCMQPARSHALAYGPAIGAEFVTANVMMPALVMEDEQAHVFRLSLQQAGVHHEEIAGRNAEIGQLRVEDRADVAPAGDFAAGSLEERTVVVNIDR